MTTGRFVAYAVLVLLATAAGIGYLTVRETMESGPVKSLALPDRISASGPSDIEAEDVEKERLSGGIPGDAASVRPTGSEAPGPGAGLVPAPLRDPAALVALAIDRPGGGSIGFLAAETSVETSGGTGAEAGAPVPDVRLINLSMAELAERYGTADGASRAVILDEVRKRDQRVTLVSGEFFPDMVYGVQHNAFLRIRRGRQGEIRLQPSAEALEEQEATREPVVIDNVETASTSWIGAQLVGAGFDVEPKEMIWREIPDGGEDTFTWIVTPRAEGSRQISVDLRNRIRFGDQAVEVQIRKFPRTVSVSVDLMTRVGRYVAGAGTAIDTANALGKGISTLLGLLGLGSLGGLGLWLRRRRSPPAGD